MEAYLLAKSIHVGCVILSLGAFAARFPDIGVRLHEDHTEALLASLRAGRFDLALTYDYNLAPASWRSDRRGSPR